ncbi:MAG: DNA cytosine methyltransferase, partial [Rectinema sp.]|nr:DNA cytosine methyltransferase [Rectinema sp.]
MNAIDLFCGAGGFSVGLVKSGFNVVFANDINRDACATYKANHPNTHVFCGDISQLNGKRILEMVKLSVGDIDIVVG